MKLKELIGGLNVRAVKGELGVEVSGISYDSRYVEKGDLFCAIVGTNTDGHRFLTEAGDRGAVGFLVSRDVSAGAGKAVVVVEDVREAMGKLASRLYLEPSERLGVIGITGTNGKTTVSYIVESIIKAWGKRCGVIGTINYRYLDFQHPSHHTTPESVDTIRLLKEMADAGVEWVVMEVSSHSLEQKRVAGIRFRAGLFTNLTREHLDYHKDMEAYFQAKARLFKDVLVGQWLFEAKESGIGVVNLDDPYGRRLRAVSRLKLIGYGIGSKDADYRAIIKEISKKGSRIEVNGPEGMTLELETRLLGKVNVMNVVCAVSTALSLGIPSFAVEEGVKSLKAVPGRLEQIDSPEGFTVIVDYAHTPDALEKAIQICRELTPKKLITVFGCGGDRDKGKRPQMGKIAVENSDIVILTSDNPRSERPEKIIEEIEEGIKTKGTKRLKTPTRDNGYIVEIDRESAIEIAIGLAMPGDIVLIAGKGHEDYQIIGDKRIHFDDREVVKKLLGTK